MRDKKTILYAVALGFAVSVTTIPGDYGTVSEAVAQDPGRDSWIPWCEHPDGSGGFECHWYRLTGVGDWDDAETEAVAAGGHLVMIDNAAENQFLYDTFCLGLPIVHKYIGYFQDKADAAYSEPGGGWKWASGKTSAYTNWWPLGGGEPNDGLDGPGGIKENWGEFSCSENPNDGGFWNDNGPQGPSQPGIIERQSLDGKIPAVSEWGLVVLTLLIVAAGTVTLMKRRRRIA